MEPLKVGIVGCGVIADIYCQNARRFRDIAMHACADIVPEAAERRASEYGLRAMTVPELMASPEVDIVLNLTVPVVHAEVSLQALAGGKHVYSEKPLATDIAAARKVTAEAAARGLRVAVAPDTVLGAAGREARRLIDSGALGEVTAGAMFVMSRGMEHWHPNPGFFFAPGAGPVFDLGPYYLTQLVCLLGPVKRVATFAGAAFADRLVSAAGPMQGQRIPVTTPTTLFSLLELASGARIIYGASWDVARHGMKPIELYGTNASLRVPDPNFMGGALEIGTRDDDWRTLPTDYLTFGKDNWPVDAPRAANDRGLGLAEMACAIREKRPQRLSASLALHVTAVMAGILEAGETGRIVEIGESTDRPAPLTEAEARALLVAP